MKRFFTLLIIFCSLLAQESSAVVVRNIFVSGAHQFTGPEDNPDEEDPEDPEDPPVESPPGGNRLITIDIPANIQAVMDARPGVYYDPSEIGNLSMGPNTNGENTYYISPPDHADPNARGNNSYDGLYPDHTLGGNHGPFATINKATDRYAGHRYGERILLRTGTYRTRVDEANLSGTNDSNHVNVFAPYGDGEVIIDASETQNMGAFTEWDATRHIYKATISSAWNGYPTSNVDWAIMDYNHRSCRLAIGYKNGSFYGTGVQTIDATDNSASNNKATTMIDTDVDFTHYVLENGSGTTNLVGSIIWNITDGSHGIVTSVGGTGNHTLTFSGGLTGGSENDFDNGDSYSVAMLDADGKFWNVGSDFYLVSNSDTPANRDIIMNWNDTNNTAYGFYVGGPRFKFYGLTFLAAPGILVQTLDSSNVEYEKCRFLFAGKSAIGNFNAPVGAQVIVRKCFFYAGAMIWWPRGKQSGGGGGWPNGMTNGVHFTEVSGIIAYEAGGEGTNGAVTFKDNIVGDNFSINVYPESYNAPSGYAKISRNYVFYTGFKAADMQELFYLHNHYNGFQRTYVKMHPRGIVLGAENGCNPATDPINCADPNQWLIESNLIVGTWDGISGYFERSGVGFKNSIIKNNTIIMASDQDNYNGSQYLYSNYAGLIIPTGSPGNNGAKWINNLIIGAVNTDGRHQFINFQGTSYSNITVDYNLFSFPGNEKFYKNSTDTVIDYATYRSLTGWDTHSAMTTTPLFTRTDWSTSDTSVRVGDLTPQGTSPAIDVGTSNANGENKDFYNVTQPYNSIMDVGGVEYHP